MLFISRDYCKIHFFKHSFEAVFLSVQAFYMDLCCCFAIKKFKTGAANFQNDDVIGRFH